jgi:hypothetical protein
MPVPRIIKNLLRVLDAEEIFRVVAVGFGTIKEQNFDTNCTRRARARRDRRIDANSNTLKA